MARAETIESVGETGIGRNGLFPQHNSCWPGLLSSAAITISSGTGNGPMQLHHHGHSLQPLQAVCVSYPSFYLHPENQDQPSPHQQPPTLSSAPHPLPLHNQGEEADDGFPGEQPGLEQEPHQEPCNRQGPLPDLLPQTEHLSRLSSPPGGPGDHAVELRVRRMALQLRSIGDELNAALLRREDVPHWQVWWDASRVLLNFITQTLSTLYRLT